LFSFYKVHFWTSKSCLQICIKYLLGWATHSFSIFLLNHNNVSLLWHHQNNFVIMTGVFLIIVFNSKLRRILAFYLSIVLLRVQWIQACSTNDLRCWDIGLQLIFDFDIIIFTAGLGLGLYDCSVFYWLLQCYQSACLFYVHVPLCKYWIVTGFRYFPHKYCVLIR